MHASTIYLYSAHRVVIFAVAQLSCYTLLLIIKVITLAKRYQNIWMHAYNEIIQDGGRHLAFVRIENSAIRSAVPENPTLEPNMNCIGSPVTEIWPFAYIGAYGTPIFGEGEVVGGQRWHHLKERWSFL